MLDSGEDLAHLTEAERAWVRIPRSSGRKRTVLQLRARASMPETCTIRCVVSSYRRVNAWLGGSAVEDFALTLAEQALFRALVARRVRFMIIGLGAALVEGAF